MFGTDRRGVQALERQLAEESGNTEQNPVIVESKISVRLLALHKMATGAKDLELRKILEYLGSAILDATKKGRLRYFALDVKQDVVWSIFPRGGGADSLYDGQWEITCEFPPPANGERPLTVIINESGGMNRFFALERDRVSEGLDALRGLMTLPFRAAGSAVRGFRKDIEDRAADAGKRFDFGQ